MADGDDDDDADDLESVFPPAIVARLPGPKPGRLSAVLVARVMGYLAVRVQFHKDPVAGVEVKFSKATPDGKPGDALGKKTTDEDGVARLDRLVLMGNYVCELEHQPPAVVQAVLDEEKPYPLILPVGRPYVDIDEEIEWDDAFVDEDADQDDGGDDDDEDDDAQAADGGGGGST